MGCNFYLHGLEETIPCPHCGQDISEPPLHIGKSSGGWVFALHVIPERDLNSLDDWMALLRKHEPTTEIRSEEGEVLSIAELNDRIVDRRWHHSVEDRDFPDGWYRSLKDFYERNCAEPGPNNLIRSKVDGVYCVGHGEGTWDLRAGEFS